MDRRSIFAVVLLLSLVSGCQNGGQQDLVVRELRKQEDQLYAMENYLSEYQQLVCKYRSENAALRQQLANQGDEGELPSPGDRLQGAPEPHGRGPSLETPESTPQQPQNESPTPEVIEEPAVPPLETTSISSPPPIDVALYSEHASEVVATSGQATIKELSSIEPEVNDAQSSDIQRPRGVWLHGEVLANEEHGGPRLVVEVEPLELAGNSAQYAGPLSLMILSTDTGDGPQSLARWDFTNEEVQAAVETLDRPAMRFYLELPADAEPTELAELWVRLLPPDGGKVLAHAVVNLAKTGKFSSNVKNSSQPMRDDSLQLTGFEGPLKEVLPIPSPPLTADWTIARPGEPAGVPRVDSSASEWRASSEPSPVTVQTFSEASSGFDPVKSAIVRDKVAAPLPPIYKRPTWTAERPDARNADPLRTDRQGESRPQRPAWSATRKARADGKRLARDALSS